jgi:catechol 2,3-dioxygenase-like lactoylglutathione lyase family enzyme
MSEQVAATPVKPVIPAVFVYVRDIKRSVEWYCRLLGFPVPAQTREDLHIFDLSGYGSSNIFLDRRDEINPSSEPLFSLTSPDLDATYRFFTENGIAITYKGDDVIYFQDPDGNVINACSI